MTQHNHINQLITDNMDVWTSAIKRKSSSGRGSSKKIELYGIKKLRELILELAVRGKLVPQDPNDEPASVLLERIAQEKAQLVKEGKIKNPKSLPDISEDEKSFELPEGWEWCRLGDICSFINGFAFKSNTFQDSGVGIVKIGDISFSGEITPETMSRVSNTVVADLDDSFKVEIDDLVIAMSGATTGKLGFNRTNEVFYLNQRVGKFIPYQINLNYLYLPLTTKISENLAKSIGSAIPNLSTVQINEIVFALPSQEEQHRIVAKVDELMALCDQLEAQAESSLDAHQTLVTVLLDTLVNSQNAEELTENWTRISGHFDTLFTTEHSIDQLKQTILQLAVMGKLVEQNPNDEPTSALLERIAAEKEELVKQKKIKKQKALPPISEEEKPFELPEGWEWVRFGWLGYDLGGGTPSKSRADYWDGNIPWVSPKDMKRNYIDSSIDYITAEALDGSTVKLIPINSLLMVVRGMILAHSFPVAITQKPVVINQDMKALVFSELLPDFVLLMLQGFKDKMLQLVDRSSHGTCKLVSEKLWDIVLAIPPLEEQHRIVAKVDELMAICDQVKARLSDAQTTQLNFADGLVEQAL